jgi:hypothetical protein
MAGVPKHVQHRLTDEEPKRIPLKNEMEGSNSSHFLFQ